MAIYDFFLSRNGAASTLENYVGHTGRLFYESTTGEIRISDGVTPGGLPIPIAIATDIAAGGIKPGALVSVTNDGVLNVNYSGSFNAGTGGINTLSLNTATETVLGGIKLGPGITTNAEGQLLIDSEGLEFTFGDFSGTTGTYSDSTDYALLQSLNEDEDIVIASNGTGGVKVVGEFRAYATNETVTDAIESFEPIFRVKADGQIQMLVPLADSTSGALEIIGNNTGTKHPPNQTGVIMHITGNSGLVSRNYYDANDNYALIVGRRYNGVAGATTAVLEDEVIFRIAAQASTDDDFQSFGPARIEFRATEDQAVGAQGGDIRFYVTPNGSAATSAVEVLELNAQTGVTTRDITPQLDETYSLGSPDLRWNNVYIGQASLYMADNTTGENIEITVDNGTLLVNGVNNLQLGEMRITDNVLTTIDTASDIVLGVTGDTGYVKLERDLKFSDGTVQSTAWTDEHYASTLLGTTLADNVLNSSLTSVGTLTNLTVTNPIVGSMSAALTAGTYLTSGGTYNGGTARTFAVDATTTNTANKIVARNTNGTIAATNTKLAVREVGSVAGGNTVTIDFATDRYVHFTITGEPVTIAYTNFTAGAEVYILITNTGADAEVNSGVPDARATNAKAVENTKGGGTSQIRATCLGTALTDVYVHFKK